MVSVSRAWHSGDEPPTSCELNRTRWFREQDPLVGPGFLVIRRVLKGDLQSMGPMKSDEIDEIVLGRRFEIQVPRRKGRGFKSHDGVGLATFGTDGICHAKYSLCIVDMGPQGTHGFQSQI